MIHSTQMYIPLKPLFSKHKGGGVQFTDEPTGNLDTQTSHDVMGLLKTVARKYQQTTILITHDMDVAQLSDRIVYMEDGKIRKERKLYA